MINFRSDYLVGAHPDILKALIQSNDSLESGYGEDQFTKSARNKIKDVIQHKDSHIYFVSGGTQANLVTIDALTQSHEAVISADIGHINILESAAVERTGHKILTIPSTDAKISAAQIEKVLNDYHQSEGYMHHAKPGLVYLTHPTELGTLYTKEELIDISTICQTYQVPLFVDGARLGYALNDLSDITLADLAQYADAFYIGGTKCGALFGEVIVLKNKKIAPDFLHYLKQHGALLAKGRALGVQFDWLFTDDHYATICRPAVDQAQRIQQAFRSVGLPLYVDSPTNQQFVCLTPKQKAYFDAAFISEEMWAGPNDTIVTRFCTSWSTREEDVVALIDYISAMTPDLRTVNQG